MQAVLAEGGGTPILQFVEDRMQTTMVTQSFEQLDGRWCVREQGVAAPNTVSLAQSQSESERFLAEAGINSCYFISRTSISSELWGEEC